MSLFKKLSGALNNNKLTPGGKSVSCGNISGQDKRPPTPPLSDFITDTNNSDVDLGLARAKDWQSSSATNTRHKSRLSKTTKVKLD